MEYSYACLSNDFTDATLMLTRRRLNIFRELSKPASKTIGKKLGLFASILQKISSFCSGEEDGKTEKF